MKWRSELKYLITDQQKEILKNRLDNFLYKDPNYISNSYRVTSLYFDDYMKTAYWAVINGVSKRWKWRVRFYNNDSSYIILEKKEKRNGLGYKRKVRVTKSWVENLIDGDTNIEFSASKLLNQFNIELQTKGLSPSCITDYERMPYIYPAGETRITLDYNIAVGYKPNQIFREEKSLFPMLDKGQAILEIKYNGFIPNHIRERLQINELSIFSYSKYSKGMDIINKIV